MKTVHVLSTAPWYSVRSDPYEKDSVELLTMILAAFAWKRFGQIHLYTDYAGAAWAMEHRLDLVYDRIVRMPELKGINHSVF